MEEESREETVARWVLERPDLAEMSKGELPLVGFEKLSATDAFKVGAMAGMRLMEVKGRR